MGQNQAKFNLKGDFIHGIFQEKASENFDSADEKYSKYDPADLSTLLWESCVNYSHIEMALDSSVEGFKIWKKKTVTERIEILKKYQEILIQRKNEIAEIISWETGKPLWETQQEAGSLINKVQVTIDESLKRILPQHLETISDRTNAHVYFKPIGPCLIIGPFNFPCHLANGQILSALLAGNSVIFKPSEKTMYSGQILVECLAAAGLPQHVVSLVQGGAETAKRLIKDERIKGIFFTGSKEVGIKILEITHTQLSKLVALEMGGKNVSIIHKDADLNLALNEMLTSCFLTTGQRCSSTSIIAIHDHLKEEFTQRFHEMAKKIIIDHPIKYEKEPFMGPLIDEKAVQNFLVYMGMANREGAHEIMRGKILTDKKFRGHYMSPAIHYYSKLPAKSLFIQSEIFGPTSTIVPYHEIEEAFDICQNSEYGLVASIFSANRELYLRAMDELEVGLLNYNRGTIGAHAKLPFGGVKSSGNYRPAAVSMIDSCIYPMSSMETVHIKHDFHVKGLQN